MPRSVRRVTTIGRVIGAHAAARRISLGVVTVASALTVLILGAPAGALPQPSVPQVQHKLAVINAKAGRLGQQYDQVLQQLSLANQRLRLLNKETASYRATFTAMRLEIGRIAAVAYEQGGANTPIALLTSSSPERVLDQSSILSELSATDRAQIKKFLSATRQLLTAQQAASHARAGILKLKHSLGKQIRVLNSLKSQEETLLAELTPTQRAGAGPGGGGGGVHYKGPTGSQADKAVAFAYNAIGCPYVFGGTGPCNSGFDCSGLMQAAWSSAGIAIPRVSYDQMGSLTGVPLHTASGAFTTRYLEPGDILGFAGNSHVGMYVGGGFLIDAPVPGQSVEKVALSGWYLQELDGAVRP